MLSQIFNVVYHTKVKTRNEAHKSVNDPSDITFPKERNDAAGIHHLGILNCDCSKALPASSVNCPDPWQWSQHPSQY